MEAIGVDEVVTVAKRLLAGSVPGKVVGCT
jgi:hypothetical protein